MITFNKTKMTYSKDFFNLANQLIVAGRFIDSRGWVPATSGNFSARLPDGTIVITVSGKHKGRLQIDDMMLLNAEGHPLDGKKPSAETMLHVALYKRFPDIQCVLHPHSLNSVLVSKVFKAACVLENYELLKALCGISTHETRIVVPIFANDQNIPRLAAEVEQHWNQCARGYGYLIAGHGLYTWGATVQETLRHLEALDFLFECELKLHGVKN
jgi:methylthioribulose-1-phosphate dehydratase